MYRRGVIGRLTGQVAHEEPDGFILDVHGVGYELTAPVGTRGRARTGDDGRVTVWVHTHVREDQISLFAFATEDDRLVFRTLLGVPNVGPRTALAILSALPAEELAHAVARKDVGRLTAIPGIGKKTAERLILELAGKLSIATPPAAPGKAAAGAPPKAPSSNGELLHSALVRMGYKPAEADRAVAALEARVGEAALPELLREALAFLAK